MRPRPSPCRGPATVAHAILGWCVACALLPGLNSSASAGQSFVNFETPHVSPLTLSADGTRLYAVNTPDNRVEVFDLTSGTPVWISSIDVGLEPVSVRERVTGEVWVANHLSDTVAIVNVSTGHVVNSLKTADEPTDVVFANNRAFISCSQANQVYVYNLANLSQAPTVLTIQGEEPRALSVSPDGTKVVVAIFESGNHTSVVEDEAVDNLSGPYGGDIPPPNDGNGFDPPLNPNLPQAPRTSMIVKKDLTTGDWLDDNGGDWSQFITWDLHDHDLAVINTSTLAVSYATALMNLNMHVTVRPDGQAVVVGTEATNVIRFEPNLTGRFVRSMMATVNLSTLSKTITDLNPHLASAYANDIGNVPMNERVQSVADPRGVAWSADGTRGYVSGLGSNNVIVIDPAGNRLGRINVGQGPTGVVVDTPRQQLYVLNRFSATVSVIDTDTNTQLSQVAYYDPTPDVVRDGRPFLYDAHRTSGLGVTACASCHIDARLDAIAWDLGDPSGEVKPFNQDCQTGVGTECEDWHPIKGPMMTQTLQGAVGTEPMHWRGDREDLFAFSHAFQTLLGGDSDLSAQDTLAFQDFLATIAFYPNPNRTVDDQLKSSLAGGNPQEGFDIYMNRNNDRFILTCNDCHDITRFGTNQRIVPGDDLDLPQSFEPAQLRNLYEKMGMNKASMSGNRGFGIMHDGQDADPFEFLHRGPFSFSFGQTGEQQRLDAQAFVLSYPTGTHAGVGQQVTLTGANNGNADVVALLNTMFSEANAGDVGVVVKGRIGGIPRGGQYIGGGNVAMDREGESTTTAALIAGAVAGNEVTFTMVPAGTEHRIGVDRDGDGFLDRDEIEHCGDPADPQRAPIDLTGDGAVNLADLSQLLTNFGSSSATYEDGDIDLDGDVDLSDLSTLLVRFGTSCP